MLIGLAGRARSGKNTLAAHLVADHGFRELAFADALRAALLHTNPLVAGDLRLADLIADHGWEQAKDAYPETRRLLQTYGMTVRAIDPDFWVRACMRHVYPDRDVVITDVRFPNEYDAIHSRGGLLVRVTRPGLIHLDHVSESALDARPFPVTVVNDGSVQDLRAKAAWLVKTGQSLTAR